MSDGGANLDAALVDAVSAAVRELGQPDAAARRLIAWLDQLSLGEMTPVDSERFLQSVFEALRIVEDDGAN